MSKRIGVGEHYALAFGFNWQALDQLESRSAKTRELVEQGYRWAASFKLGRAEYLGVSKDDFAPIKGKRTLSGAGQIALHPELRGKTYLVAMEEPVDGTADSDVAVVGLLNGHVVFDDVIPAANFKEVWGAFVARCNKASVRPQLAGRLFRLGTVQLELEWVDFVPAAGKRTLRLSKAKTVPVKALEPVLSRKMKIGLATGISASLLAWGYVAVQERMKIEAAAEERARAQRDFPARYAASVNQLLREPVMLANSAFAELRRHLHSFPVALAGWRLRTISCEADGKCRAVWENARGLSTNREFVDAAPKEWKDIELTREGNTLSHALPFALSRKELAPRDQWPDQRTFLLTHFSQWQRYWVVGFHPVLEAPKLVGMPPGDALAAESYPMATFASKWSIPKTTPWYLSDGFDKTAEKGDGNLGDNVTVQRIELHVDGPNAINFEAEGLVYARK